MRARVMTNLPLELVMIAGAVRGNAKLRFAGHEQDDVSGFGWRHSSVDWLSAGVVVVTKTDADIWPIEALVEHRPITTSPWPHIGDDIDDDDDDGSNAESTREMLMANVCAGQTHEPRIGGYSTGHADDPSQLGRCTTTASTCTIAGEPGSVVG